MWVGYQHHHIPEAPLHFQTNVRLPSTTSSVAEVLEMYNNIHFIDPICPEFCSLQSLMSLGNLMMPLRPSYVSNSESVTPSRKVYEFDTSVNQNFNTDLTMRRSVKSRWYREVTGCPSLGSALRNTTGTCGAAKSP